MSRNRQIHIVELPKDKLGPEHFRLAEGAIPQPKDGELLLKTKLISLDAANRAWMQGATYRAAIEAGQVMATACDGFISLTGDFVRDMASAATDEPYRGLERVGKKAAGRLLDGRTWDEVPK